jgi:hypothetical protein
VQACLIAAKENFLSMLPSRVLKLIQQSHLQIVLLDFNEEQGDSLVGSPEEFVLQTTFRYNIRIYAPLQTYSTLSRADNALILISAARCSDATINLYYAKRILDNFRVSLSYSNSCFFPDRVPFELADMELMMALSRLAIAEAQ